MYESLLKGRVKDLKWLYVDESILSPEQLTQRNWSDDHQILCKIGMTTKESVTARLLEWQNTCKHKVVNLTPEKVQLLCNRHDSSNTLSKMFQRLSITPKKKTRCSIVLELKTYRNGGFYVNGKGSTSLSQIEKNIHNFLWKKYGQGLIYCYGCDVNGRKRHKEWFRVTIKELNWILKVIDDMCYC